MGTEMKLKGPYEDSKVFEVEHSVVLESNGRVQFIAYVAPMLGIVLDHAHLVGDVRVLFDGEGGEAIKPPEYRRLAKFLLAEADRCG